MENMWTWIVHTQYPVGKIKWRRKHVIFWCGNQVENWWNLQSNLTWILQLGKDVTKITWFHHAYASTFYVEKMWAKSRDFFHVEKTWPKPHELFHVEKTWPKPRNFFHVETTWPNSHDFNIHICKPIFN